MKGLLQQFLSEAADLLEHVDTGLLELERDPRDRALLDVVFRAAHTLKGSSGLFDLPPLTRLTHAAEDLLDAVRAGRLELTAEMTDDLLTAFDLIRRWLPVIDRTEQLPPEAVSESGALSARLRAPLGGDRTATRVPSPRTGSEPVDTATGLLPAPEWLLDGLGRDQVERVRGWLDRARTRCRVLRFEPGEQCFFAGGDPLHLVAQIPAIEVLELTPREPWPGLQEFDEYRCLLVFTVVTRASLAEVEHLFRYVPDELSVAEVDADGLARLLAAPPSAGASPLAGAAVAGEAVVAGEAADTTARQVLAAQLRVLRADLPAEQACARISSVGIVAHAALAAMGRSGEQIADLSAVLAQARLNGSPGALADLLERELALQAAPGPAPGPTPGLEKPKSDQDPGTRSPVAGGGAVERRVDPVDPVERRVDPVDRRAGAARVLKVDQASVDRLLDLVGQLVVAKNGLPFLAAAAEEQCNARVLGRQIKDHYGVVNRITEELQAAVIQVRMLPMAVVFARFPRMIRDLARTLGKEVVLEQEGQDTAADKDIIEMLADPLVHLVRNSLDHGIEPPDQRIAAGKPARATLRLRAVQEQDAVVIDVIDDGRGIDPAVIRHLAYRRGLVTEEQVETMSDQDAVNLVFLPGFSTADRISDVSGRGVGLDAVRAGIEAVGGSVRLSSSPGRGSQVRLRVPLSMAVSRVMIVTVAGQRFGVPIDLVIESVRVPQERVRTVEHQEVVVLRDTVVPLVDLARTLQLPGGGADRDQVSVLVTRPNGGDVGLLVDAFHEGAEVIVKPMEGILAGSPQFCGTALLGDGSVLLVLDVVEVLAGAGNAD